MKKTLAAALLALASSIVPAAGFAPNVTISTIGATAPDAPLRFENGSKGSLADYRGSVVVATFWQESCPFCRIEMPRLNQLSAEMPDIQVAALALDQDMAVVTGYLDEFGYDAITPIIDEEKFNGTLMSVEHFGRLSIATPTSYVIDKRGVVRAAIWGPVEWNGAEARSYLSGLAAE